MKKQNVVLKVGIGLMLGLGAMVIAPKAAQAATPCTPEALPSEESTPPCPVPGTVSFVVQAQEDHLVAEYDLDGDCTKETEYWVHNGYLLCSGVAGGMPFTNVPCIDKYYFSA